MIKILFTLVLSAQAGWLAENSWLAGICQRHLIAHDPYQFEQWSIDDALKAFQRLETKRRWGKLLEEEEIEIYGILKKELNSRIPYVTPEVEQRIRSVLPAE